MKIKSTDENSSLIRIICYNVQRVHEQCALKNFALYGMYIYIIIYIYYTAGFVILLDNLLLH